MNYRLPLTGIGLAALVIGALTAAVACKSEAGPATNVTGEWRFAFGIRSAPVDTSVGESFSCQASLRQTINTIGGQMTCSALAASADITGFGASNRAEAFVSAQFEDSTLEVSADTVLSAQMAGTWESDQGLAGRFVAIRDLSQP